MASRCHEPTSLMSCKVWCSANSVFTNMSEQTPKPKNPVTKGKPARKQKRGRQVWGVPLFMILAGAFFLLTSSYALYLWQLTRPLPGTEQARIFVVEKGDTLGHVLRRLEADNVIRSEEHTSELQSQSNL